MFKRLFEWFSGRPVEAGGYALALVIGSVVVKELVGDAIASAINKELVKLVGPVLPEFGVSVGAWLLALFLLVLILFLGIGLGKRVFEPKNSGDEAETIPEVFIWQVFLFLSDGKWYDRLPAIPENKPTGIWDASHAVEQAITYDMLPIWAKQWHRQAGRFYKIPNEDLNGYHFSMRDIAEYMIGEPSKPPHELPLTKVVGGSIGDTYVYVKTTKAAVERLADEIRRNPGAFRIREKE